MGTLDTTTHTLFQQSVLARDIDKNNTKTQTQSTLHQSHLISMPCTWQCNSEVIHKSLRDSSTHKHITHCTPKESFLPHFHKTQRHISRQWNDKKHM